MSILPSKKTTVSDVNPKTLVLFGGTKQGKTTAVAGLEDNLIIDLEEGTRYYESLAINVPELAKKSELPEWDVLKSVLKELKDYRDKHHENKYKYITIDTVGVLEKVIMPYCVALYKVEPRNKNYRGDDLTTVPNGAGWGYIRTGFFNVLAMFNLYCDSLILVAHTKLKTIKIDGEELNVTDIDVSGKMAQMLAAKVDAIGLVYRKDDKTLVNFNTQQSVVSGARPKHIQEKIVTLVEKDGDTFKYHWNEIFK